MGNRAVSYALEQIARSGDTTTKFQQLVLTAPDIDLDEFTDEIEPWIIDELKRVGCDTARSVLNLTADELERRTDLEKETIEEVRRVLKEEFEKE